MDDIVQEKRFFFFCNMYIKKVFHRSLFFLTLTTLSTTTYFHRKLNFLAEILEFLGTFTNS